MWYMVVSELRKLWRRKAFWMLLSVIIATNLVMLFYTDTQKGVSYAAYKKLDGHLQTLTEEERKTYLGAYEEKTEGLLLIENIHLFAANNPKEGAEIAETMKSQNQKLYNQYYEEWKRGNDGFYTTNIFTENDFMEDAKSRTEPVIHYGEYLQSIMEREEDSLGIFIFAGSGENETEENAFSKQVIRMTAKKYRGINNVTPQIYTYRWVDNFAREGLAQILLALLTFLLVYQMVYEEKKRKLFQVIRAMPRGRVDCIFSKIIALFLNIGLVTGLMYGAILAYSAVTVGIFGMNGPIQSVSVFLTCPYQISVWQFLLMSIGVQWLALFLFALALLLFGIVISRYVFSFAIGIGMLGGNVAFYYGVPAVSKWNGLHYLNLWQFFKAEQVIGNYVLLNVPGQPRSVCSLMIVLLTTGIVLLVVLCSVIFAKGKRIFHQRGASFGIRLCCNQKIKKTDGESSYKISRVGFRQRIYKRVWGYESYKILIMNLGILLIILFGVGMAESGKREICYLTPNEMRYRQWMQNLSGELTEEKETKIQNQKAYYDGVLQELEELDAALENNKIGEETYEDRKMYWESKLALYPAFLRVYERYEYVKQESGRQFVYEEGYHKLLGQKNRWHLKLWMFMYLTLILFLTPTFTTDKEKGMYAIIRTAPKGRGGVVRSKIAISLLGGCCMYLCVFLRNYYVAQKNYGMKSFLVSASNLKGLECVPESISTLILLVGVVLLQLMVMSTISMLLMLAAARIGNAVHAIMWELIGLLVIVVVVNQMYPFMGI